VFLAKEHINIYIYESCNLRLKEENFVGDKHTYPGEFIRKMAAAMRNILMALFPRISKIYLLKQNISTFLNITLVCKNYVILSNNACGDMI
jgi:hypothetical protein